MPREPQTESYNRKDPSVSASQTFPSYKRVLLCLPCCNILRAFLCLHGLVLVAADRNLLHTVYVLSVAYFLTDACGVWDHSFPVCFFFCYYFSSPRRMPTEYAKYYLSLSEIVKAFLS